MLPQLAATDDPLLVRVPLRYERYPEVRLEVIPTDRVVDLVEEGIDLAIRVGRLGDSSFMARKIGDTSPRRSRMVRKVSHTCSSFRNSRFTSESWLRISCARSGCNRR